jgi:chemotaxis methyl-accepting protein methylase
MSVHAELSSFVSERTGIELTRGGIDRALHGLAARRQQELGLTPRNYLALLKAERSVELERVVNSITVGYTWFFRDPSQLASVESLLATTGGAHGKVRIWIPGCSTGEEAYSVALLAERAGKPVEILATDLNSRSVEQARRGVYGRFSMRDLDPRFVDRFTRRNDGAYELRPELRERVTFAQHNLLARPPVPSDAATWDIVLCRNVLIYFDRDVALGVLESLTRALAPGGHLVLGASEVVCEVPNGLTACYVANRLAFRRGEPPATSGAAESGTWARDWLLEPAPPAQAARVVSVFPASGEALVESAPPAASAPSEVDRALANGHGMIEAGDVVAARTAYLEALRLDPIRADAHMHAGVAHYLCGEVESALHHLRAALFLDDGLWPAAFYLALCHENSGHPEEALRAFQQVVRLDALERDARRSLGSMFDAWRDDLCELARKRVHAASSAHRLTG